jgi:small subunit ribosomal protein S9
VIDDERREDEVPEEEEGAAPPEEGGAGAEDAAAAEEASTGESAASEEKPEAAAEAEGEPAEPKSEAAEEEGEPAEAEGEAAEAEGAAPAEADAEQKPARPRKRGRREGGDEPEAIPGAHLEPDLVLEEEAAPEAPPDYAEAEVEEVVAEAPPEPEPEPEEPAPRPVARTPMELAADARYHATGKRKTSVARVILRPGSGTYTVNGRPLEEYFPRDTLQRSARLPLETAGYESSMDVNARIHGGGVSSQADALRHGIARALIEADPGLRGELKRRGFLTRDARVKERKKAGLKKARKRPQFSKR